jgi:hypothetical protein
MSNTDQTIVALAGLMHDIGELYIAPEYLRSDRRLYPHEWRHVVVHPRIGQMLISGLENYPKSVAQAVYEHHERCNGGGYPRQVAGNELSPAGQVVSAAEMIAGVFQSKDKPLQRAALAMKIIPGEFAHELISVVSNAVQIARAESGDGECGGAPAGDECKRVRSLYDQISGVMEMGQRMIDAPQAKSKKLAHLLSEAMRRATVVRRACSSVGFDACLDEKSNLFDAQCGTILFETAVATREIAWRLRDIARDISLQAAELEAHESEALQPLIALLDGTH